MGLKQRNALEIYYFKNKVLLLLTAVFFNIWDLIAFSPCIHFQFLPRPINNLTIKPEDFL